MSHAKIFPALGWLTTIALCGAIASRSVDAAAAHKPATEGSSPPLVQEKGPVNKPADAPAVYEREFLVAFDKGIKPAQRADILGRHGLTERERVGAGELYLVESGPGIDAKALIRSVSAEPGVRYIEPNLKMSIMPAPSGGAED